MRARSRRQPWEHDRAPPMRFSIRYRTEYRYDGPVADQHNSVRVKPASTPTQQVERFRLTVEPSARLHEYVDYFGTEVIEFNVPGEHDLLVVTAEAMVTTQTPADPPEGGREALAGQAYSDAAGEFLLASDDEPANGALAELKDAIAAERPADTLRALCQLIPDRFEYRPGATYVGSTVDDLLAGGAGVCQDFVHLSLILLRSHGIAARYVSGYLFAAGDASEDSAEVNTHAWVEALLPAADGGHAWVGGDPTNRTLVGEQHVKIGHGRHYGDVAPIKGVYRGASQAGLDVGVEMRRLAAAA
jgi:transglutaminase-like putative cysteine protease